MIRTNPVRSRLPVLIFGGVLLVANVAWLISFQVLYVRRAEGRERAILENDARLVTLRKEREVAKGELERARSVGRDRESFYKDVLGTAAGRLTDRVRRLRELAGRAGLRISALTFALPDAKEFPVETLDLRFTTAGSYADLKKFLNSIELDEEFLGVTELGLVRNEAEAGRGEVSISLEVRTAFHDPSAPTKRKRAAPAKVVR